MAKDANTKAIAKLLHGQGKSSRYIAKECDVTQLTAMAWAKEWTAKGFPKGYTQAKLEQVAEKAMTKERERQGLNKARVEAKVLELMEAQKNIYFEGSRCDTVNDNGTQLGATSLAADILHMKRNPEEEALTAGIYSFYKNQLAQKRAKK